MLCKTELLYWVEIPRTGGDLRTVLPEASAEARTALDLDERGLDPIQRANLKERHRDIYERPVAQWNAIMLPLDPQSFTLGFTGEQLAGHFGVKAGA